MSAANDLARATDSAAERLRGLPDEALVASQPDFRAAVEDADWAALAEQGASTRALALDHLELLAEARATALAALPDEIAGHLPADRKADWSEFEPRLRAELEASGQSPGQVSAAIALMANLRTLDVRDARLSARRSLAFLDLAAARQLSALASAELASALARFNAKVWSTRPDDSAADIDNMQRQQAALRLELYEALGTRDGDAIAESARALGDATAADLAVAAADAGALAYEFDSSVRLGDTLRRQLTSLMLARTVTWIFGWPDDDKNRSRWSKAAAKLPSGVDVSDDETQSLASAVMDREQGKIVSTEGVVEAIHDVGGDASPIHMTIRDPGGSVTAQVALPRMPWPAAGPCLAGGVRFTARWTRVTRSARRAKLWELAVAKPPARPPTWASWVRDELEPICALEPWGEAVTWALVSGRFGSARSLVQLRTHFKR